MKKLKKLNLILIFSLFFIVFQGCENPKYISLSKKPSNYYHSKNLYSIIKNENYELTSFDSNFYKEIKLPKEDKSIIEHFFSSLTSKNFVNKPDNLPKKPLYKIFIKSSKAKYVINIFNKDIISIFPWDDKFKEDYISISDIPFRYNLLDYCNNLFYK